MSKTHEIRLIQREIKRYRQSGKLASPLAPTVPNLAAATREVNTVAKQYRDEARASYQHERFDLAARCRRKRKAAYALKDRTLGKAGREGMAGIVADHRIGDAVVGCWAFGGLRFHQPLAPEAIPSSAIVEDLPEDWKGKAVPARTRMPLKLAKATLWNWLEADPTAPRPWPAQRPTM